ncbi:hypothetical protein OPKNFCMD_0701 [Methylobacterium crusticola]|uniref:Flp family type IVb pilin n=1 Tax=Methylobacterium crusticola TaxID=1697972 RepID=A0ABQ4QRS6_9HYPH|nr:Flp family type IVb pilin [Methylobacterium crusticola]GJD47988.1 hypothetical protein OPKNFCMD_0701 [Methylobacterium crusticola]
MTSILKRFVSDESGATAIEYGLLASLIAVAIIGAATTLGSNIGTKFNNIAGNIATGK